MFFCVDGTSVSGHQKATTDHLEDSPKDKVYANNISEFSRWFNTVPVGTGAGRGSSLCCMLVGGRAGVKGQLIIKM